MATNFLVGEKIWFHKFKYGDAERRFYEQMNGPVAGASLQEASMILHDIARARENIPKSLAGSLGPGASSGPSGDHSELVVRIASLEVDNQRDLAERAGEELARPLGHSPADPAHVSHAPSGAPGQEASHTSRG
ncbi:hCG33131 [Homo sapiens]|uniref:Putative elongation factor 1-delta-like protein n=1 Tax=Homo sapiens TaxID=9606 RepID=EF1DL_HUMAN